MKRLPILLLGLSLVANAALVWKLADSTPASSVPSFASAKPEPSTPATASAEGTLADLRQAPLPQLVAQLRAAGFTDKFIRAALEQRLFAERQTELDSLQDRAQLNGVWWRDVNPNSSERKARIARRDEIAAQIVAQVDAALGVSAAEKSPDPRYAFLSAEKIAAVKELEKDYQAVSANASQGSNLRESRSTIEAEKKADLAAILTPAELAEYELRFSTTANEMRSRLSVIEATEAEYRALFPLHQAYDRKYRDTLPRSARDQKASELASQQLREQIIAQLGPERGGDYVWSRNGDYQNLKQISSLAGLPASTALNVVTLREEIGAEGMTIVRSNELSSADKLAALVALSATAQKRLDALLPASAQAQVPPRSVSWVSDLAKGRVTTADPLLGVSFSHHVNPPGQPRG